MLLQILHYIVSVAKPLFQEMESFIRETGSQLSQFNLTSPVNLRFT